MCLYVCVVFFAHTVVNCVKQSFDKCSVIFCLGEAVHSGAAEGTPRQNWHPGGGGLLD